MPKWTLQESTLHRSNIWVMECADVFKEGEYWYLTYSDVADRKVHYRYAKSPATVDETCQRYFRWHCLLCRQDDVERYRSLAGWCPTYR